MPRRPLGLIGGLAAGAVLTGVVLAASVWTRRRRSVEDRYADEPFGQLAPGRISTVTAIDGVPLEIEEIEPADSGKPELTVVLVHGFAISRLGWHFQQKMLARLTSPRVRQVLYDQRSHGKSGLANEESSTI